MVACIYVIILILQAVVVNSQSPAILSVRNVLQGATATFECSYPSLTSPTTLDIYKDNVALYQCIDIASTCSKSSTDSDYSGVSFIYLGTASAKGTFTVANTDQTRDGGKWTCKYGTSLISSPDTFVVSDTSPATLTVTNVLQGATATFECSYPNLESPTALDIYKDNVPLYQCPNIAFTCSYSSTDIDYSDVTFTDLDTESAKGTFTVANTDQTRDGGDWTCKYGSSLISSPVSFVVTDDCSWSCLCNHVSCWQCIGLICVLISVAIGVVILVWYCWCRLFRRKESKVISKVVAAADGRSHVDTIPVARNSTQDASGLTAKMPKQHGRGKQPVDQTPADSSMPKQLMKTSSTLPPTDAQNAESIVDKVVQKVVATPNGRSQVDTIPVARNSTQDASDSETNDSIDSNDGSISEPTTTAPTAKPTRLPPLKKNRVHAHSPGHDGE